MALGLVSVTTMEIEEIVVLKPGEIVEVGDYRLRLEGVQPFTGPNFTEDQAHFALFAGDGTARGKIVSAKRFYAVRGVPTTEAGIRTLGFSQLYVSIGEVTEDGGLVVRAWWKPWVTLIWLGSLVMMIGGTLSLLDRRLRVGAPMPRRKARLVREQAR